ncbi:MAG TPA: diacylglycerol kinase family protein [Hanamia sp.]|jgi:diacylglycerol kinase|nr:diacylglycerol kinase family protein [Hanamia sp.]
MRVTESFVNAFHGLRDCIFHEKNFRIQYVIAILIVITGIFFRLNATEWVLILICFAMVLSFEIINSAIEKLCDLVCPDFNLTIKKVKDMAASAVLLSAIISFIIGCIIFLPKIKMLFFH